MKKKKFNLSGFSIMELIVSFMVVAVIVGASTPIFFKKSSKMKIKSLNSITTKCDSTNADCSSYGDRCQLFKKRIENGQTKYICALCKPNLISSCNASSQYFDNETCKCLSCSKFDTMVNPNCTNCCVRCNSTYCTGCAKGVGLEDRTAKMGCKVCQKGYYSDNSNGVDEKCKKCPEGYYCPEDRQTDGKKYKCPVGYYCPEGTKDYKDYPCPAGCYCPDLKMGDVKETVVKGLECPTGTNNKTYPCIAGCYCPSGMGVLKQVDPSIVGRTLSCPSDSSGTTYPCSKDYYCPTGSKKDKLNSCDDWRPGTVTVFKGASNTTYCHCKQGYYLLGNVCTQCAAGTYKTDIGDLATLCLSCPAGYFCPTTGMSIDPTKDSTKKCSCGTFSTGKATKCADSGAGYYTPATNEVYASRAACGAGTYASGNANCGCAPTPPGAYQPFTGQAGYIICPAGSYCPEGSANHTLCLPGTYQPYTGQSGCAPCSEGTYQPHHGQTGCAACSCGTYQPNQGQAGCAGIPDGKFANKVNGATTYYDTNLVGIDYTNDTNIYVLGGKCYRHANSQADCNGMTVSSTFTKGNTGNSYGRCVNDVNRGTGGDGGVTLLKQYNLQCGYQGYPFCWDNEANDADNTNKTAGDCQSHTGYTACHRVVCNQVSAYHLCNIWHSRVMSIYDFLNTLQSFKTLRFCDMTTNSGGIDYCAKREGYCGSSCRPALLHMYEGTYKVEGHALVGGSSAYAGSVRCTRVWFPY